MSKKCIKKLEGSEFNEHSVEVVTKLLQNIQKFEEVDKVGIR